MDFIVDSFENLKVQNVDVTTLLTEIYVNGGFTRPDVAKELFKFEALNNRGTIICAIEKVSLRLAGVVIFVSSDSSARRLAQENESEIHLLGVKEEFRSKGLGNLLICSAVRMAKDNANSKMILWTQKSMKSAQKLYINNDFVFQKEVVINAHNFLLYERDLSAIQAADDVPINHSSTV